MEVNLTPHQEAFLEQNVRTGRFTSPEEAVRKAIDLLEEQERALEEWRAAVNEGDEDFTYQRYSAYSDRTLPRLADELKREARAVRSAESGIPD